MGSIFWFITYYLFCIGVSLSTDECKKWKLNDYVDLLISPVCTPIYVGVCIGVLLRPKGTVLNAAATEGNAKAVEAFKQMCPFHDGRCRPNCKGCARLNQFIEKLNEE